MPNPNSSNSGTAGGTTGGTTGSTTPQSLAAQTPWVAAPGTPGTPAGTVVTAPAAGTNAASSGALSEPGSSQATGIVAGTGSAGSTGSTGGTGGAAKTEAVLISAGQTLMGGGAGSQHVASSVATNTGSLTSVKTAPGKGDGGVNWAAGRRLLRDTARGERARPWLG